MIFFLQENSKAIKTNSTSKQQKNKDESSIKRFINYSKGVFENLIALHVDFFFKNQNKT